MSIALVGVRPGTRPQAARTDARATRYCESRWLAALTLVLAGCAWGEPAQLSGDETALRQRAEEASRHGDWELAADLWGECAELERGRHPLPYIEVAAALLALEQRDEAHAALCTGLELFPNDRDLLAQRAMLASEMGFHRAAEKDFEGALAVDAQDAELWEGLGRARLALELPESAKAALVRCLHVGPETPERVALLARALTDGRDHKAAAQAWEHAIELCGPRVEPALEWELSAADALARPELGEPQGESATRALALYQRALARHPQSARASYALGVLLERRGDVDNAKTAYLRAVEVDNLHVDALERLASIYVREGNRGRANEMVERALKFEKDEARCRALREIVASAATPSSPGR